MARRQRIKALFRYYLNPKFCLNCHRVIMVGDGKVSEARIKDFCNHRCFGDFKSKQPKKIKIKVYKIRTKMCDTVTKGYLFNQYDYPTARSIIQRDAHDYFCGTPSCKICGYDKHIEICHIIAVSKFNDDALIRDINASTNLVGLCPNHHWEFDNGLIKLGDRYETQV